ncbi:MAG: hypothetical protein K2N11_03920 [Mucispirillum sp.]|nr:hypothetical protein [Mucispirillum sp.]
MYINRLMLCVILMLVVLSPLSLKAESDVTLAESMLANLTVANTKKVVLTGKHGVLKIFFEKASTQTVPYNVIHLTYEDVNSSFKMQGNSVAITQDGKLVFAVNGDKVYAKAVHGCKENLKIIFKNIEYVYNEYHISIINKNDKYSFSEVVYDANKHTMKVYNNGKYVKTVEMKE